MTTTDYALAQRLFVKHKGLLTRAEKSKQPEKILAACDAFFADFHANDLPLPDAWHRWNIAKQDAEMAQRRAAW